MDSPLPEPRTLGLTSQTVLRSLVTELRTPGKISPTVLDIPLPELRTLGLISQTVLRGLATELMKLGQDSQTALEIPLPELRTLGKISQATFGTPSTMFRRESAKDGTAARRMNS